jgi:prophage tail gpP-like protein
MLSELMLRINGVNYYGWESVKIVRGIESIAGAFELSITDRWSRRMQDWPIKKEDRCTISYGSQTIFNGFVENKEQSFSANSNTISVSGRDEASSLIDCSVQIGANNKLEYTNINLFNFVQKLCSPFGIAVQGSGDALTVKIKKIAIDPGSTVFSAIEKACRPLGFLPVSSGTGTVILSRAGTEKLQTALVENQNILSGSSTEGATDRFYTYKVIGQHQGNDSFSGLEACSISATATDANVRRSDRVLVVLAEGGVTSLLAKKRAEWEATVRAARGFNVTIEVQGWTQKNGDLWPINKLVRVISPSLGVDSDMLISETTFSLNESGSKTQFKLVLPDSFIPQPEVPVNISSAFSALVGGVN